MPDTYDDVYRALRPKEQDFTGLTAEDEEKQTKALFDILP